MREALEALLKKYVRLAESGDCGNWDPELEPEVIAAHVALVGRKDHITGLEAKIKAQARELAAKDQQLKYKTAQITALGHIWCTGCGDVPSEESVVNALREVERMVTRYTNNADYLRRVEAAKEKLQPAPAPRNAWVDHSGRTHLIWCKFWPGECCCHAGPVDTGSWFACCCPALKKEEK